MNICSIFYKSQNIFKKVVVVWSPWQMKIIFFLKADVTYHIETISNNGQVTNYYLDFKQRNTSTKNVTLSIKDTSVWSLGCPLYTGVTVHDCRPI